MNREFNFSRIDETLPGVEKMQEKEHATEALEENYKIVRILCNRVKGLETKLSETLPKVDGAASSLQQASRTTISECSKQAGHLSDNNCVSIPATIFWYMIEAIISLAETFICTCATTPHFQHNVSLWKQIGRTVLFLSSESYYSFLYAAS